MPINRLYRSLRDLLVQLRPTERKTRLRNFSWLLAGLFLSRSVPLTKFAKKTPSEQPPPPSVARRLSRLVNNPSTRAGEWYEPLARRLLECQARKLGEVRLIVDGSKVGFKHRLLMVGLAYRKRAIPIAWSWVPSEKGHSSSYKQRALLGYVRRLIPDGAARVSVVGDSEFGAVELMEQLEEWGFYYVLRQKSSHLVCCQRCSEPHRPRREWRGVGEVVVRNSGREGLAGDLFRRLHAPQTKPVVSLE